MCFTEAGASRPVGLGEPSTGVGPSRVQYPNCLRGPDPRRRRGSTSTSSLQYRPDTLRKLYHLHLVSRSSFHLRAYFRNFHEMRASRPSIQGWSSRRGRGRTRSRGRGRERGAPFVGLRSGETCRRSRRAPRASRASRGRDFQSKTTQSLRSCERRGYAGLDLCRRQDDS